MGFPILLRWHLYIESGPWAPRRYLNRVKSIADHACGFRGFDPIDKNITLCMVLYFPLMRITRTIDARFVYVCHWYAHHCYDVANRYVTIGYMMTSSNGNIFRVTGPFVRGIHWSPVYSPHKGQWLGHLLFSLIHTWTNGWANNWNAGDLKLHRVHYDVTVMIAMQLIIALHEAGLSDQTRALAIHNINPSSTHEFISCYNCDTNRVHPMAYFVRWKCFPTIYEFSKQKTI